MTYNTVVPIDPIHIAERLSGFYGAGFRVTDVRPGYRSVVTDVEGPGGPFVLKSVNRSPAARERLSNAVILALRLPAIGVPTPRPVAARGADVSSGPEIFLWDDATHVHVLYERSGGDPFDPSMLAAWCDAGAVLGRLHSAEPVQSHVASSRLDAGRVQREIGGALVRLRGSAPPALLEELASLVSRSAVQTADRERALVHGDYRGQNLLFRGSNVSAVLDLDEAGIGDRLLDLAYAVVFLQSVYAESPPSQDRINAFLDGYAGICGAKSFSGLAESLGLALARGMTLWCRICYLDCCGEPPPNVRAWIEAYRPLVSNPASLLGRRFY